MTPPNPPPEKAERRKQTGLEPLALSFAYVVKALFWVCAIFESAVILAAAFPEIPLSRPVLDLTPNSDAISLSRTFLLGWFLSLLGALLRRQCYRILSQMFTFEISLRKDHKLITTGPYSIVRHPSYTSALLCAIGTLISHLSTGSWVKECSGLVPAEPWKAYLILWFAAAMIAGTALLPRMKKEDALLKESFGKEWDDWARRVPYRLIPGLY